MKIKDILTESPTDLVAHIHKDADDDIDRLYNPESATMAETNKQYYKDYFKEFFQYGKTPVFTNEINFPINEDDEDWTNKPSEDHTQSAGYRGQQSALSRAGVPHDKNVQKYDPSKAAYTAAYAAALNGDLSS